MEEDGPDVLNVLVGDEAFVLSPFPMKPCARRNNLNLKKIVLTYRLS